MNKTFQNANKTISILGCGWLGLPLAEEFIKNGIYIKGSTPTHEKLELLTQKNIRTFQINLNPKINSNFDKDFFNAHILIVNFPPKRREDIVDWHTNQVASLIGEIRKSDIKNVIFISSTSVYADINNEVTEENMENPSKKSGKALRIVEELFFNENDFQTTVIRFGGLIGYDRKPGRFFAGKKQLKNGDAPVNLIHRDDCIGIIQHVIKNEIWGEVINACCPIHPTRKEFYKIAAQKDGFDLPEFVDGKENYKIINCDKLKQLGYSFKYQDPIDSLKA
ncbi:hypothetical protein [Marinifilum sp. D714]|uniref:hypothetical protein n=1 Tax=Marinifilum sp. D714 TaxID=2937523 RepID=UPI0027CFF52F|nr:hypothetical protein [Marinifilum sp. D714]MDQ2177906.1 hypothetical protein [Marinifilum sp. D714]